MNEVVCENASDNIRMTATCYSGINFYQRNNRKSVNTIPFRKLEMTKAGLTQQVITSRRDLSFKIVKRGKTKKQVIENPVKALQKAIAEKSMYFDKFLSDFEILNDYKMMSHIGKGCFSTVTLAVHKQTNKNYAIKTYEKIDSLQWHRLQSIKREIKHLKKLHHQNVIELYHVMRDKKKLLLLMDKGGKQTLSGLLRKSTFFTEDKAKFYFKQIVKAVAYCHTKGVCHRDLKPQNILVDDEGNVKIIDFGFSENAGNLLTSYCGTPPFMSPQITKKAPYNGASADVWALGIILYLLTVGSLPFRATNEPQLNRLIQQGKYPVKDSMSKGLKNILNKLLNCQVTKRASASSILQDPWLSS